MDGIRSAFRRVPFSAHGVWGPERGCCCILSGLVNDRHYCSQATPKMGVRQIPHYLPSFAPSQPTWPLNISQRPPDPLPPRSTCPHPALRSSLCTGRGGSAAHTHTSSAHTVHSHPPRGDSRRVPPARGSIGCPSQYFSKSLVTCAMVLPLVSGSLLKVNHPKKKVRPTKIR